MLTVLLGSGAAAHVDSRFCSALLLLPPPQLLRCNNTSSSLPLPSSHCLAPEQIHWRSQRVTRYIIAARRRHRRTRTRSPQGVPAFSPAPAVRRGPVCPRNRASTAILLLLPDSAWLGIQGRQSARPRDSAPITAATAHSECKIMLRRAQQPLAVLSPPVAAVLVTAVTCQGSTQQSLAIPSSRSQKKVSWG